VSWKALAELKQQIPLLEYLQAQDWKPAQRLAGGRVMGLCPLHADRRPSFLVEPGKNLFYCYGCGRGGDVIRFAELYHGVRFTEALTVLWRWRGAGSLLEDVSKFYQIQLHCQTAARRYLAQRGVHQPEVIEQLRIGFAPGRCLGRWLPLLGHSRQALQQAGLLNDAGHDSFSQRIVFPLEANLYGRSIGKAVPHRLLPGVRGGLYGWEKVRRYPDLILVEGLFDLAVLWQAGFPHVTCALGNHLNARQRDQLRDGFPRTLYLAFDSDDNGSGQQAAARLAHDLQSEGLPTRRIQLPDHHDPNSFFVNGGQAHEFHRLLAGARL
jgi:DNA primase